MPRPASSGVAAARMAMRARQVLQSPEFAGLVLLAVILALLELSIGWGLVSSSIIARPSDAIAGLFTLQRKVDLFGAFQITTAVTATAVVLELLVAIPFGYFLFRRREFGLAYTGWLAALFAAPVFLLYPLFLVIFGRTVVTLIIMGFLPGVIPLILQVQQGFLSVPRVLINVGHSFDLTERQIFWKIMVPAAAPSIFTGFRLALMYTLINIIAIEYLVDIGGLGRVVADRYFRFDIPGTYSAIIAVTIVSIMFNYAIGRAERLVRAR
jgi:NitT/TauT family transport system permease protein